MTKEKKRLPDSSGRQNVKGAQTNKCTRHVVYIIFLEMSKLADAVWDMHLIKDIAIGLLLIPMLHSTFAAVLITLMIIKADCYVYDIFTGKNK